MMLNIKMLWLGEYRFGVVIVIAVEHSWKVSVLGSSRITSAINSVVTACH